MQHRASSTAELYVAVRAVIVGTRWRPQRTSALTYPVPYPLLIVTRPFTGCVPEDFRRIQFVASRVYIPRYIMSLLFFVFSYAGCM